jgi:dolichyl-phosphate-mannose--protein O-mannosyl transferase
VLETERAALLAVSLLLVDGVYLVQSRVAMTNIFAVLFQVTSALLLLRAATRGRLCAPGMLGLGLCLGLALSTRWTSLFAWAFLGLVLVALRGRRLLRPREALLTLAAFVLVPLAVYAASYVPLLAHGHLHSADASPNTLGSLADVTRAARQLWDEQAQVWRYHADVDATATHAYVSPWWTWPWLYRPTWYFWWSGEEWVRGIVALGNPALWWASVPAAAWAIVSGARARDPRRLFAGAGFFFSYLPWGLSPRTLNFSHYLFEAIPYACLALGAFLDRHWNGRAAAFARGYVALAALLFLLFLPLLTAMPVPEPLWSLRFFWGSGIWTWFPRWV